MIDPTNAREQALAMLDILDERRAKYEDVNKRIRALNPDFPGLLICIDPSVETAIIGLLDTILGDGIASYYLNEVPSMEGGGYIRERDGTEWPIRSTEDVRAYVNRTA